MRTTLTRMLTLICLALASVNLMAEGHTRIFPVKSDRINSAQIKEAEIRLEPWMIHPFTDAMAMPVETAITIESWMLSPDEFLKTSDSNAEPEQALECWMTSTDSFGSPLSDSLCDTEVRLESWMLNF